VALDTCRTKASSHWGHAFCDVVKLSPWLPFKRQTFSLRRGTTVF
jgi:hypothetical protein